MRRLGGYRGWGMPAGTGASAMACRSEREREREREVEDDRETEVEDDVAALGSRSDGYKPSPERIGVFRLM